MTDKPLRHFPAKLLKAEDVSATIAKHLAELAYATLADICVSSKNQMARYTAAKEILERGFGKLQVDHSKKHVGDTNSQINVVFGNNPSPATVVLIDDSND